MARIPSSILRIKVPGETFAAALPELQKAYCGTIAYEIEHLSDHQKRLWLRGVIESGRFREPIVRSERRIATLAAPGRGRRLRALPAPHLPRPEDVLHRGRGRARADHRPGHRAVGRRGHRRGRDGHGPPRTPRLHHPRRRAPARVDPGRVRGPHGVRVGRGGRARDRRRREVPPGRRGHLHHAQRPPGDGEARRQPEPPGAGQRRRRGPHPRPADLAPDLAGGAPRPHRARSRCSSTATRPSPARAWWPRR